MTNHPMYSPPPQQPGYNTAPNQPVPPAYAQGQQSYNQQFDWRYQQPSQPQYRSSYDPLSGSGVGPIPGQTGPGPIPGNTGVGTIPQGTGAGPIPGGTGAYPIPRGTGTGPIPGMLPPMGPPPRRRRSAGL
ncbi:MAG: putative serine protease PepD, partial [Mycobacterium sp.]|nr:putative serine protease PepD [Mycobacterium sp.]